MAQRQTLACTADEWKVIEKALRAQLEILHVRNKATMMVLADRISEMAIIKAEA